MLHQDERKIIDDYFFFIKVQYITLSAAVHVQGVQPAAFWGGGVVVRNTFPLYGSKLIFIFSSFFTKNVNTYQRFLEDFFLLSVVFPSLIDSCRAPNGHVQMDEGHVHVWNIARVHARVLITSNHRTGIKPHRFFLVSKFQNCSGNCFLKEPLCLLHYCVNIYKDKLP